MTKFLELLISGISLGFVYALIALGFVIMFKATEVVNFAHGSLLLTGGYAIGRLQDTFGFYGAVVGGCLIAALIALVIERGLLRRLRGAPVIALAILTIGIDILLLTEITRRIGIDIINIDDPWSNRTLSIGDISIAQARAAAIVVALLIIAAFFVAFKYSNWGIAMRATAEDGETAGLMGIRLSYVTATAWVVAAVLAAIAAIFLTSFPSPGLDATVGFVALRAFPAAILGGLDSTGGALVGGLAIGVVETMTAGYQNNLLFLGRGLGDVMPYVVMLIVLLVRPSGLFGTKELTRV